MNWQRPDDVDPILKPEPKQKGEKHERGCKCKPCQGRRNRRSGLERQRKVAREMGVAPRYRGQLGNEETWGLSDWQVEVKSGGIVPKVVIKAMAQAEAARAIGDGKRVVTVWCPAGTSDRIAVLRLEDLVAAVSDVGGENLYGLREIFRHIEDLAKKGREEARG